MLILLPGPDVNVPLLVLIAMGGIIALLLLILWSVKRRREPSFQITPPKTFRDACESITGLTHGEVIEGNEVTLLQNGDAFFPTLLEEIGRARSSLHFETYLWREGEVSDSVTAALAAAAQRGVEVRVLLDANGGKISKQQKARLLEAGAQVRAFHPWRFSNLGRMNNRDHRKIVIVDGNVAFVGGHCIVDTWLGHGQDKKHFRDITALLRGPGVHALQSTFSENWVEETGDVFVGQKYFPPLERAGECSVHVARVTPAGVSSSVKLLHYLAIECAREKIRIQNPYFLPDPEGIEALCRAVERGVDVRVMLPSAEASDNAIVQHASHHKFGALLEGGVRLFEYGRTLLHQKVLTVDGVWSAVGSTNFDDRSFELNDEVTMGVWDEALAKELEETFEKDLEECREATLEQWKNRGFLHKLKDGAFFLVNEQL